MVAQAAGQPLYLDPEIATSRPFDRLLLPTVVLHLAAAVEALLGGAIWIKPFCVNQGLARRRSGLGGDHQR